MGGEDANCSPKRGRKGLGGGLQALKTPGVHKAPHSLFSKGGNLLGGGE